MATTVPETSEELEEEVPEEPESKTWIAVVCIGSVLVVLNIGALVFRRPRGGKYRNR